jgi:hypothetical protein
MFEHDYDKKPFELFSLKEQLAQAGLLEEELEKLERERPCIDELVAQIAKNKANEPSVYWRFKDGGLNYFHKHISIYKWLSRKQLHEIDGGLYFRLLRDGDLEKAISHTIRRDFTKIDPVAYFKKFHAQHCTTVIDLYKRDQTLYVVLRSQGKLDDLLTKKVYVDYKKNPLALFNSKPEYQGLTRSQLNKINRPLYRALHYYNQMDDAIPLQTDN